MQITLNRFKKRHPPRHWLGGRHRYHYLWIVMFLALQASCEWFGPPSIHITAEEFRFTPIRIEWFAYHPVRLLIRNQGRERHVFHSPELFGPGCEHYLASAKDGAWGNNAILLDPGQSVELPVVLAPGLYPFRCWIKGHTGMEGIIDIKNTFSNK